MTEVALDTRAMRPQRPPTVLEDGPADTRVVALVRLESAQALADAGRYDRASELLAEAMPISPGQPRVAFRALLVEGWIALAAGSVEEAEIAFRRARELAESPAFDDAARAEALMRLGACNYRRASNANAVALLTLALELCDRAPASDRVRAQALVWRARCYQRQRDWEAARADIERALELAAASNDDHAVAHAYFQASLVAERQGQWLLARYYAEEARTLFETVDDRLNIARLTNNLGGLLFLLGHAGEAAQQLERAHELALDAGSEADAAQALSSLAQVHLRTGHHAAAAHEARSALELLGGRRDFLDEIGNASLVLGRALLEQGELAEAGQWFDAAELSFADLGSDSHRAAAWVAQGDLAARTGDAERAASLYRRAAEALQDFHF